MESTKERAERTYRNYEAIRNEKGLSDYAVAEKANIWQSALSDWKAGKSTPKVEKMLAIAEVLEVPIGSLL